VCELRSVIERVPSVSYVPLLGEFRVPVGFCYRVSWWLNERIKLMK